MNCCFMPKVHTLRVLMSQATPVHGYFDIEFNLLEREMRLLDKPAQTASYNGQSIGYNGKKTGLSGQCLFKTIVQIKHYSYV